MTDLFTPQIKVYAIGLNQSRLLTELARTGVKIKNVKCASNKSMTFTIKLKDREKVFAIMDKMCYNIIKVVPIGFYARAITLARSVGVAVGVAVFLILSPLPNFIVSDIVINGDGRVYEETILDYLHKHGVKEFSLSTNSDYDSLADGMLIESDKFSYVSVKKSGSQLVVTAMLKEEAPDRLRGQTKELLATADGIVKEVKVYKGKALVNVGDFVKMGDLLVTGDVDINGVTVSSNVYATITVETERYLQFVSQSADFEDELSSYIKSEYGDDADYIITKKQEKNVYAYFVTVKRTVAMVAC